MPAGRAAALEARLAGCSPRHTGTSNRSRRKPPRASQRTQFSVVCPALPWEASPGGWPGQGLGATRPPSPARKDGSWCTAGGTTVSVSGRLAVAAEIVHSHASSVLEHGWKPRAHRLCAHDREPWPGERPRAAGPPRSAPTQTPGRAAASPGSKHLPSQDWSLG